MKTYRVSVGTVSGQYIMVRAESAYDAMQKAKGSGYTVIDAVAA